MPTRSAKADWQGDVRAGHGKLAFSDIEKTYSYTGRVGEAEDPGTNPEELIGAAQAACFSMALAARLTSVGSPPQVINTTAKVTLTLSGLGLRISRILIETRASVPGMSAEDFATNAQIAKDNCPVSNALAGVIIDLDAALQGS